MKTNIIAWLLLLICSCFGYAQGPEKLRMAAVFTDHMVLQRDKPLPVYGTAGSGAHITVHFSGAIQTAVASANGTWKVVLKAMPYGGPYEMTVTNHLEKIVLKNILMGDVWLCAGQSNMDFQLKEAETGHQELSDQVSNPNIRLFKMYTLAETGNFAWDSVTLAKTDQLHFFSGSWKNCSPETAGAFSAVGYYFGKTVAASAQVPIGLIQVAVGGSPTESWIEKQSLLEDPVLAPMLENWQNSELIMAWCRERAAVNLKNATAVSPRHPYEPGYNFEAGIKALTGFPIKGVLWYQGESNAENVALHARLFPKLVTDWRKKWGYEFPFYYVQLSGIDRKTWPEFRDSQRKMLDDIPNSGMAVSYDLGDSLNVHPIKKQEIGERLAQLALCYIYKKKVIPNGPLPALIRMTGDKVFIQFSFADGLSTKGHQPLTGFELVTYAGERLPATAVIFKNQVHINIPVGQKIKSVCYAYQPFTPANLINAAGLPATTFLISIP